MLEMTIPNPTEGPSCMSEKVVGEPEVGDAGVLGGAVRKSHPVQSSTALKPQQIATAPAATYTLQQPVQGVGLTP